MIASLGGQENIWGITSAAVGILSVICCVCTAFGGGGIYLPTLPFSIFAIVAGILHLRRVKAGQATNQKLALIGIILGGLGLLIAICGISTNAGSDFTNDIR